MVAVMTRACSAEIAPCACAAAVAGNSGANTSPVNVRRGASWRAARTRARAACTPSPSSRDRKAVVEPQPRCAPTPRASTSANNT